MKDVSVMPLHDHRYDYEMMKRALRLAKRGAGFASPNPMVGAVIVENGKVMAEGYHHAFGLEHAEVDALKKLDFKARGMDMYVSLEPCSHYGKTPPCVDAILKAGISNLHVAMVDPNPLVAGRGFKKLRKNGVSVEVGILEEEAKKLNESFIKYITTRKPFVVAKAAITLDGKIATQEGDSGQFSSGISSEKSHLYAHKLRKELDAILVGGGTVKADNPRLTCRLKGKVKQPVRLILDGKGVSPVGSVVFNTEAARTILVTSRKSDKNWRKQIADKGTEIWLMPAKNGRINLNDLMTKLGENEIASLLVEGGSEVLGAFKDAGLIDRLDLAIAPMVIGGCGKPVFSGKSALKLDDAWKLSYSSFKESGGDILIQAYPEKQE